MFVPYKKHNKTVESTRDLDAHTLQDKRHTPLASTMSLSMPRGPRVVRTMSAIVWQAEMFDRSWARPWEVSVPSFRIIICGCCDVCMCELESALWPTAQLTIILLNGNFQVFFVVFFGVLEGKDSSLQMALTKEYQMHPWISSEIGNGIYKIVEIVYRSPPKQIQNRASCN